jgi:hypothetical protein
MLGTSNCVITPLGGNAPVDKGRHEDCVHGVELRQRRASIFAARPPGTGACCGELIDNGDPDVAVVMVRVSSFRPCVDVPTERQARRCGQTWWTLISDPSKAEVRGSAASAASDRVCQSRPHVIRSV